MLLEEEAADAGLKRSGEGIDLAFPGLGIDSIGSEIYRPVYVRFGDLRSPKKISCSKSPKEVGMTIFGLDVINQFCWLFDFQRMEVTISADTIPFDNTRCVKIPYTIGGENMLCPIVLGKVIQWEQSRSLPDRPGVVIDENNRLIVNDILIDTGAHGFTMIRDSLIPNVLMMPNELPGGKFKIGGNYLDHAVLIPHAKDSSLFYNDGQSPPQFSGYIDFSKDFAGHLRYGYNGILPLGKQSNYSQIYFDTRRRAIYLKP